MAPQPSVTHLQKISVVGLCGSWMVSSLHLVSELMKQYPEHECVQEIWNWIHCLHLKSKHHWGYLADSVPRGVLCCHRQQLQSSLHLWEVRSTWLKFISRSFFRNIKQLQRNPTKKMIPLYTYSIDFIFKFFIKIFYFDHAFPSPSLLTHFMFSFSLFQNNNNKKESPQNGK